MRLPALLGNWCHRVMSSGDYRLMEYLEINDDDIGGPPEQTLPIVRLNVLAYQQLNKPRAV